MNDRADSSGQQRHTSQGLLKVAVVFFVCVLAGFLVPLFGFPLMLVTFLLLSVSTPQTKRFVTVAIALFAGGAIGGAILPIVARGPFMALTFLFLPYIVAPLLVIIAFAIQLHHRKPPCSRVAIILMSPFLLGFSLLNARTYVIWVSPFIYMPPAITNETLKVYKECIKYVKNHEEMKELEFNGGVVWGAKVPTAKSEVNSSFENLSYIESGPETAPITRRSTQIMCPRFERHSDIVIFYKGTSHFLPMTAKEIWHIWPSGHGVAYSLNGQDPNKIDDPILMKYRPYFRIHGNWYFSRGLLMIGNVKEYRSIAAISKTLIDRSSCVDDIDPNDLDSLN